MDMENRVVLKERGIKMRGPEVRLSNTFVERFFDRRG